MKSDQPDERARRGKTSLLERVLRLDGVATRALEGDVPGSLDADRLTDRHVPGLITDPGVGGECHLDANVVRSALPSLALSGPDSVVIENVGNLVCAARSAAACSTAATTTPNLLADDLARINKVDLLEHVDFDLDVSPPRLDTVHPGWSKRFRRPHCDARGLSSCGRLWFAGSDAAPAPVERYAVHSR